MGCGSCGLNSGFNANAGFNAPNAGLVRANNGKSSRRNRRANRRSNRNSNRNNVAVDGVANGFNGYNRNGYGCCGCGCLDGFFCCGGIGYSADPLLYDW